jgi:hypothetical protein
LDGHSTHVTIKAVETCKNNNIRLICLPAHSSHILQPLDVGVYCHVKKTWKKIISDYYATTKCKNLDKENFPPLIKKLYENNDAFTRLHAIAGFENTGFYPLDKNNIDKNKLRIAQTFNLMENHNFESTETRFTEKNIKSNVKHITRQFN